MVGQTQNWISRKTLYTHKGPATTGMIQKKGIKERKDFFFFYESQCFQQGDWISKCILKTLMMLLKTIQWEQWDWTKTCWRLTETMSRKMLKYFEEMREPVKFSQLIIIYLIMNENYWYLLHVCSVLKLFLEPNQAEFVIIAPIYTGCLDSSAESCADGPQLTGQQVHWEPVSVSRLCEGYYIGWVHLQMIMFYLFFFMPWPASWVIRGEGGRTVTYCVWSVPFIAVSGV